MKKNFLGIFALSTCLLLSAAGCEKKPTTPSYNVQSAANYLQEQYLNKNKETRVDYDMPVSFDNAGVTYTVVWTVSDLQGNAIEYVKVKVEDGKAIIDLDELSEEELRYELKGVVKAPDGTTAEVKFLRTLLEAPAKVTSKITAAPQEGVTYQYHVYQSTLGKDLYFAGSMNGFYFKTTEDFEEATNVYVEYVENSTELFNIYFNDENNTRQYIGVKVSSDGQHDNIVYDDDPVSQFKWNATLGTVTTTIISKTGNETEFYLGNYSSHNTISASAISYAGGAGNNVGHLVTLVDRDTVSDEDRVLDTKKELKVTAAYIGDATVELQTAGLKFPDVKVDWAVTSNNANYSNGVLTLTAPTANTDVTLTATIKSGDKTDTADFTIKSVKNDTASILDAAFDLESGESFGNEATLTGVVNAINKAYDSEFGNIESTFIVNNKAVYCYRLTGTPTADVQNVAAGDTITVTGTLTNYNGMVQFGQGCEASNLVDGTAPKTDITIEEALAFPVLKDTTEKYTTSGTIKSIIPEEKTENGVTTLVRTNVYIVDEDENELYIYGIDAGEYTLAVGDTITVNGVLSVYKGVNQFKNATVTAWTEGNVEPEKVYISEKITSAPVEGVAYKYYVYQSSVEKDCYFTGKKSGDFFETSEKLADGVDLYVEYVDGSTELFNIYFLDSNDVRQYIGVKVIVIDGANKDRPAIATTPVSQFKWNADKGTITTTITAANGSETEFYIGNYSNFETLSASKISYAGSSGNNVGCLLTYKELTDEVKVDIEKEALTLTDEVTGATEIDLSATGTTYTDVVITWAVDEANATIASIPDGKLTIAKVDTETTITVTATLTIGEGETAVIKTKVFEITAKVPAATAEEKLAAEKEALTLTTTTYDICVDTEVTLPTTPTKYTDVVISWALAETNTNVTLEGNILTILGSANTTIKLTATLAIGEGETAVTEPKAFEITVTSFLPTANTVIGIPQANKYANSFAHNTYSSNKYYVVGEITEIKNTTYGNMYISDADGNTLYVYGLYQDSACKIKYESMDVKPIAGDTVKIYGILGKYNSDLQMKNAYLAEYTAAEGTAATKVAEAKTALILTESVTGASEITLPATGSFHKDVAIAWELTENACASMADGKLVITNPEADTTVTVTATLTLGTATDTKEFTIAVTKYVEGSAIVYTADFSSFSSTSNSYSTITSDGWSVDKGRGDSASAGVASSAHFCFKKGTLSKSAISGGISKLSFNYTFPFSNKNINVTITITDSEGQSQAITFTQTNNAADTAYKFVWDSNSSTPLNAVSGPFSITITNNIDKQVTIWNLTWIGAPITETTAD